MTTECQDCQTASEEGQALLRRLTGSTDALYSTRCDQHRADLLGLLRGILPASSKADLDYSGTS